MKFKFRQEVGKLVKTSITTIAVTAVVLALRSAGAFQLWELVTLDRLFKSAPLQTDHKRVVIVAIDEEFIQTTGQWPLPDALLAETIKRISAHEPVAIGLDLYRDLPVRPGHQDLLEVYQTTPNLIGIEKVTGDKFTSSIAPPAQLKALDQVGFNDVLLDNDGKLRRALLSIRKDDGDVYLSLPSRLALMYLERQGIFMEPIDE
jgi:adenylate cyclase